MSNEETIIIKTLKVTRWLQETTRLSRAGKFPKEKVGYVYIERDLFKIAMLSSEEIKDRFNDFISVGFEITKEEVELILKYAQTFSGICRADIPYKNGEVCKGGDIIPYYGFNGDYSTK